MEPSLVHRAWVEMAGCSHVERSRTDAGGPLHLHASMMPRLAGKPAKQWRKVMLWRFLVPTLVLVIMMHSVPMSVLNDQLLANRPNCSTTLESAGL
jgi:hypothetical protein